ncbi:MULTISPECIES: hydroxyisourate hydrolase [unclassified Phaeobacter]|uniref:hydroxyisourate hydrolase n=1 Tax=unclassified Phaeobacter TaxID=2621772 RepID=UPI003A88769F
MALISSHTLNGTDGTHAGGIAVRLTRMGDETPLFSTRMDDGGRLSQEVDLSAADQNTIYELTFQTAPYWAARGLPQGDERIIGEIVLRFSMPDPGGKYHMPVILNPNSYSTWASS